MTTKKTTHRADTPQWMYYSRFHHSVSGDADAWEQGWFDVDHSIALENLFTRKNEYPVQYVAHHKNQLPLKGTITSADMDTMLFLGKSEGRKVEGRLVRVVDTKALRAGVAYFQDPTFETFSPEASTQIMDSYKFGRVSTAIFVGGDHYAITLRPIPMQTRVATGKIRPIFIPPVPMITTGVESMKIYPENAYDAVTEGLPEYWLTSCCVRSQLSPFVSQLSPQTEPPTSTNTFTSGYLPRGSRL